MANRTILERMRRPREESNSPYSSPELLTRSVLENLTRILNTRHGDSLTDEKFGLPDLAEYVHSLPEGIDAVGTAVKNMIALYEPRLKNVQVFYAGGDEENLLLKFEVRGSLKTSDDRRVPLRFQTVVSSTGEFQVAE